MYYRLPISCWLVPERIDPSQIEKIAHVPCWRFLGLDEYQLHLI